MSHIRFFPYSVGRTFTLAGLLLLLVMLGGACRNNFNWLQLTSSGRQIRRTFSERPVQPCIDYWDAGSHKLRYWEIGADTLPVAFLIHGAPSAMGQFRRWVQDQGLYEHMKLVAVDRPGYGRSRLGKAVPSISEQADMLAPLLKQYSRTNPVVLFGSSYGGSVAVKLAMDHPEEVDALVLLSASVLPMAVDTPDIAFSVRQIPFRWMYPRVARVATREKFTHTEALREIQDGWDRIRCPGWILHGRQDPLIYFSNAEYALRRLAHTQVTFVPFDSMGHNIFWNKMDTVKHFLLEAKRRLEPGFTEN